MDINEEDLKKLELVKEIETIMDVPFDIFCKALIPYLKWDEYLYIKPANKIYKVPADFEINADKEGYYMDFPFIPVDEPEENYPSINFIDFGKTWGNSRKDFERKK